MAPPLNTDHPQISLAYLPPTPRQTRVALAGAGVLLLGLAVLLPFAATPLPKVDGFITAFDAIISVTDLITACLLLAHFSITRSRALWALGCGYLFSAVIVVIHGLTFPGVISPTGNLGKAFWNGVRSGQSFAFETRSLRARDGTYRWHLQQAVVLRDPEGQVLKFVGTTTDIDDQKRTEEALRQAQGDLARINRVTTMGELAASLAHELSQPITGALTNANVCLRRLGHDIPDLDEVRAAVTKIGRDAQRAAEIIRKIRSQFERGASDREVLDVNGINRETVALLRDEAARYNISVRTELAADLPQIVGDRVQLQQVAMNLIVNGIEAMKDVDGLREIVIKSQPSEDGQILVSVSDTGIGFPPQLTEQIFDPFFTTKPHGTGMGLRISRSIIVSHGGHLWAVSSPGRGATFHFNLPAAQKVPQGPASRQC